MASSSPPNRGREGSAARSPRDRRLDNVNAPAGQAGVPASANDERLLRAVLEQVGDVLRGLGDRLAACERGQDAIVAAIRDAGDAIHARSDEILDELTALRAVAEPPLLAAPAAADRDAAERHARYREAVGRLRGIVRRLLPRDARVLVVSHGDDDLLRLSGRPAGHFPQDEAGNYAGHHPADDAAALAHLADLAAAGWRYLVVPEPAFWWLDHYPRLRAHLDRSCAAVYRDADTCAIWALDRSGPWVALAAFVADFHSREGSYPAILDWESGRDLAAVFPECAVFAPLDAGLEALPYIDESIDVVAVAAGDDARLAEARRVAAHAVVLTATNAGADAVVVERRVARLPGKDR